MKMKNQLLCLLALIVVAPAWGGPDTSVTIELNNLGKDNDVSTLVAKLEKDPVYKSAGCGPAEIVKATTKIKCAKADSKLMAFLDKNAPPTVAWDINDIQGGKCNVGCVTMHCPPPNGPITCCSTSTYQACP